MRRDQPLRALAWKHSLQERETATGYLSRLAALNGVDMRTLMRNMRFHPSALDRSDPDAIGDVAALGGMAPAQAQALLRHTPCNFDRIGPPTVAGQTLPYRSVSRTTFRFCPHCVHGDLLAFDGPMPARPWLRLEWVLDPVRSCRRHCVELFDAVAVGQRHRAFDFSEMVAAQVLPRLDDLRRTVRAARYSAFEDWILARIDCRVDPANWLDAMPLGQGIRFCEGLGVSARHPSKVLVSKLTRAEWSAAATEGFNAARLGERSIHAILGKLVDAQIDTRGVLGLKDTYGHLFDACLTMDDTGEGFRAVVRRHAFGNLPLERGTLVLGERLQERRVHTIHSAALASGTTPQTMRRILVRKGVKEAAVQAGLRAHRVSIRAKGIEEQLSKYGSALTTKEVKNAIGIPRLHLAEAIDRGFIPTLFDTHLTPRAKHRIAVSEVRAFMGKLFEGAVPVTEPSERQVPIMTARQVAGSSLGETIGLVIGGTLAWKGRLRGGRYGDLLVDAEEVRRRLRVEAPRKGLTKGEVAQRLIGIHSESVTALMDKGLLEEDREFCPRARYTIPAVTLKSFEDFTARYVTLGEVCKVTGLNWRQARSKLASNGVPETTLPSRIALHLYEREQVVRSGIFGRNT